MTGTWDVSVAGLENTRGTETYGPGSKLESVATTPSERVAGGILETRVTGEYKYSGGKLTRIYAEISVRAPNADAATNSKLEAASKLKQAELIALQNKNTECDVTWIDGNTFETVESQQKHTYKRRVSQ